MPTPIFKTARKLANKTVAYFRYIQGEGSAGTIPGKEKKLSDREPESATITGLALFIGFNSRQEMEDYEQNGAFGYVISRACLRIEALYEKKLHQQSPSGAVFALKTRGWKEKTEDRPINENRTGTLKVEVVESGLQTADSEVSVVL